MKPIKKPSAGEIWVRRRDLFVVIVDAVTRTQVTVSTRIELLVYTYSHKTFQRYFRLPVHPIGPEDFFERPLARCPGSA